MPIWLANLLHILAWPTRQWWWRLVIVGWIMAGLYVLAAWVDSFG